DHSETLLCMDWLAGIYAWSVDGRQAAAIKLFEESLTRRQKKFKPNDPGTLGTMGNLIELLAAASDPELRNPSRALELARKAVELSPNDPEWRGGRGIALYGTGDWEGAKADLQYATDLRKLKNPDDLGNQAAQYFFLAMAHWKLGEND